jgi:cysteine desulfurase/selenocysteine lyase
MDPELRGGVVPFNLPGIHPHDVAQVLDRQGIAIRAGHHCTMPLHERLDLAATARASFNVYTTTSDVDALVDGIGEVKRVFGV